RGAHNEGLVGDDHSAGVGIENHGVHLGKVPPADLWIIGWKHVLGLPPRSVALDNAGDRHIADGERSHLILPCLPTALAQRVEAGQGSHTSYIAVSYSRSHFELMPESAPRIASFR